MFPQDTVSAFESSVVELEDQEAGNQQPEAYEPGDQQDLKSPVARALLDRQRDDLARLHLGQVPRVPALRTHSRAVVFPSVSI
jgi:hypothetical protein